MKVTAYDRGADWCHKLPSCAGMHLTTAHERVQKEREVFSTVFENGDPDLGQTFVLFFVLPMLELIRQATGLPRCWRCGKVGKNCKVYNTMEPQPDGTVKRVVHYCGID